tara:strand:- start:367 stop:1089 length:723 start_codon:yes stop_codon:yes gene_type:complete
MPRKPSKTRMYFTQDTEDAIVRYNDTTNTREKNAIYNEHLRKPFEKLVENIIHTFKFYYFDIPIEDVKHEVISFLITRLSKYKQGNGKAFSYFSVVVKNWLICHNNGNYKKMKTHKNLLELNHKEAKAMVAPELDMENAEKSQFFEQIIDYWLENIPRVFKKDRDINIAYSIIELMDRLDSIEIFNKKALYILLREISGAKTQHITKVINTMKSHYGGLVKQWEQNGVVNTMKTRPPIPR